jgi:hypothetical protein
MYECSYDAAWGPPDPHGSRSPALPLAEIPNPWEPEPLDEWLLDVDLSDPKVMGELMAQDATIPR